MHLSRSPLLSAKLATILRFAPTLTKYLIIILFLVNIRSLPLAWHIRVFRPAIRLHFQHKLLLLQNLLRPKAVRIKLEDKWFDSISPIGQNPLKFIVQYNTRASIDDCDFNGHLNNCSYAKTLDSARLKSSLAMFPVFFRAGGWIALAATHYNFIREIPMLAPYEVRLSIGAWDNKWIYVIAKFVSIPSKKQRNAAKGPKAIEQTTSPSASLSSSFPSDILAATMRTTSVIPPPSPPDSNSDSNSTIDALKSVTASLSSTSEPDGATLHTISVSKCCFKVGRITVPPALVFAINGFCTPPSDISPHAESSSRPSSQPSTPTYSQTNPPPHWAHVKALVSLPNGGNLRKLRDFLKGGWKDVTDGERWWYAAMGGIVEERRKWGMEVINSLGVGAGIDGARVL